MAQQNILEQRLQAIESRNQHVEANKAWETSFTRRVLISLFIYLALVLYLRFVLGIDPWLNSIGPTIGFLLSTLTLPYFQKLWQKYIFHPK